MTNFQHSYYEHDGVTLHFVEATADSAIEDRPLVLFYHGFPLFWYSFHHQMTALKERYRVVAVDGPGINLSSKPAELDAYRLPKLAEQLEGLSQHLVGDEPFFLVGHDWGGALAWSYAQAYSHRLRKVVGINAPPTNQLLGLLETNADQQARSQYMYSMRDGDTHRLLTENGGERMWKNAYAKLRMLPHYTFEHDENFRQGLAQPGAINGGINWYRANIPPIENISDSDYWPSKNASTSAPGLLIWGETDETFVSSFIEDLPDYVPNLEVQRLPNVGHSPMLEAPDEVSRILLDYFAR